MVCERSAGLCRESACHNVGGGLIALRNADIVKALTLAKIAPDTLVLRESQRCGLLRITLRARFCGMEHDNRPFIDGNVDQAAIQRDCRGPSRNACREGLAHALVVV